MKTEGAGTLEYLKVDRKSPEILAGLDRSPIYEKFGFYKARPAIVGEEVITKFADKPGETRNFAKEGDMVITNPDGEKYIVPRDQFPFKYKKTNQEGVYEAIGLCKTTKNPFGKPVEIFASWGRAEFGDEDCLFADACDEKGKRQNEPYIIAGGSFGKTYRPKKIAK